MSMKPVLIAVAGLLVLVTVGAVPVLAMRLRQAAVEESLPVLYPVPDFSFTDQDGDSLSRDALKDKIWVADFIFTTCNGPCPVMSGQMATLHTALADEKDVEYVSVSVDPETDTPEVLRNYAKALDADTSRWHFLTGPIDSVMKFGVEGMKVGSAGSPLLHDQHFILVDRQGMIRGYYMGTEEAEVKKLEQDIRELLRG